MAQQQPVWRQFAAFSDAVHAEPSLLHGPAGARDAKSHLKVAFDALAARLCAGGGAPPPLRSLVVAGLSPDQIWAELALQHAPLLATLESRVAKLAAVVHRVEGASTAAVAPVVAAASRGERGTRGRWPSEDEEAGASSEQEEEEEASAALSSADSDEDAEYDDDVVGGSVISHESDMEAFLDAADAEREGSDSNPKDDDGDDDDDEEDDEVDMFAPLPDDPAHPFPTTRPGGRPGALVVAGARYADVWGENPPARAGDPSDAARARRRMEANDEEEDSVSGSEEDAPPTRHASASAALSATLTALEEAALAPKPWELVGEVASSKRPQNSLLQAEL